MDFITEVVKCSECPFHAVSMGVMDCRHPNGVEYFITQSNSNGIPKECPLRIESITTTITLKKP